MSGEFSKGWKPLFAGVVGVATGASPIPFNVLPIVLGPIHYAMGWSFLEISIGITIYGILGALLAPAVGGLADKYGVKPVAMLSLFGFGCAFSLLYFTPSNILGFYAMWALIGIVGIVQQTAQIAGSPLSFAIQNTGSAKVYGLELDFRASPTKTLSLFGQLGLQHDKYGTLAPGSTGALNNAKRIPFTPRVSGQAGFSLDQPLTPTAAFLLGSSVTYSGPYYSAVDNTLLTNSSWRLDGYVGASFYSNYEFRLRVNNLTNERAVYCCATTNAGVKVLEPRSIMAELSFRF